MIAPFGLLLSQRLIISANVTYADRRTNPIQIIKNSFGLVERADVDDFMSFQK